MPIGIPINPPKISIEDFLNSGICEFKRIIPIFTDAVRGIRMGITCSGLKKIKKMGVAIRLNPKEVVL